LQGLKAKEKGLYYKECLYFKFNEYQFVLSRIKILTSEQHSFFNQSEFCIFQNQLSLRQEQSNYQIHGAFI